MRLIDANALISDLEHDVERDMAVLDTLTLGRVSRESTQFDKDWKQNTIDLLMRAPTIESERKKGKWIEGRDKRFVKCSKCGMETTKNELEGISLFGKNEPNYCPNCGADMRGGGSDE